MQLRQDWRARGHWGHRVGRRRRRRLGWSGHRRGRDRRGHWRAGGRVGREWRDGNHNVRRMYRLGWAHHPARSAPRRARVRERRQRLARRDCCGDGRFDVAGGADGGRLRQSRCRPLHVGLADGDRFGHGRDHRGRGGILRRLRRVRRRVARRPASSRSSIRSWPKRTAGPSARPKLPNTRPWRPTRRTIRRRSG